MSAASTIFIVGLIIFCAYVYFFYSSTKQKKEGPTDIGSRDTIDYDGMGNYGRFPSPKNKK
tara:strand:- start:792 stop:974 length:183 start_codon:yes stop_codon:yes gene_type:complete